MLICFNWSFQTFFPYLASNIWKKIKSFNGESNEWEEIKQSNYPASLIVTPPNLEEVKWKRSISSQSNKDAQGNGKQERGI